MEGIERQKEVLMKDYAYAVYIGRFQPFHNEHLEVVRKGLEIADEVIIVIGSCNAAPNIRNPWSFEDRRKMIADSVFDERRRVHIVGVVVRRKRSAHGRF